MGSQQKQEVLSQNVYGSQDIKISPSIKIKGTSNMTIQNQQNQILMKQAVEQDGDEYQYLSNIYSQILQYYFYDDDNQNYCCRCCNYFVEWKDEETLELMKQHVLDTHQNVKLQEQKSELKLEDVHRKNAFRFGDLFKSQRIIINNNKKKQKRDDKSNEDDYKPSSNESEEYDIGQSMNIRKLNNITYGQKKMKSKIWHFFKKLNQNQAFCNICEVVFTHSDRKNRMLWRHVRKLHKRQLMALEDKAMHTQKMLQKKKIKSVKDVWYNPLYAENKVQQKIDKKTSQTNLKKVFPQYLINLKKRFSAQIRSISSDSYLETGFILTSQIMRQNYQKYKTSISIWYDSRQKNKADFESVVYILSQDQFLNPLLLGIVILFKNNQKNIQNGFMEIIKLLNLKSGQNNNLVLFVSEQIKQCLIRTTSSIFINAVYFQAEIKNMDSFHIKKSLGNLILFHIVQDNSLHNIQNHIGFTLSYSFVERVKQIYFESVKEQTNLFELLTHYLQYQIIDEQERKAQFNNFPAQIQIISSRFLSFQGIIGYSQLKLIRQYMSRDIFIKLCYTYIYGCFFLRSHKFSKTNYYLKESRKDKIFQSNTKKWDVNYLYENKKWYCSCGLYNFVGLPCPHLVHVLILEQKTIIPYIHKKWLIGPLKVGTVYNSSILAQMIRQQYIADVGTQYSEMDEGLFLQKYWQ